MEILSIRSVQFDCILCILGVLFRSYRRHCGTNKPIFCEFMTADASNALTHINLNKACITYVYVCKKYVYANICEQK